MIALALLGCGGPQPLPTEPGPDPAVAVDVAFPFSLESVTSSSDWRAAFPRIRSVEIRWPLRSWGGETSSSPFVTPDGPVALSRTRFVALGLGESATLETVVAARQPVVACLEPSDLRGPVTVTGRLWGVTDEGGIETLWIRGCTIAPECASDADCIVATASQSCSLPCPCPVATTPARAALTTNEEGEQACGPSLCEACETVRAAVCTSGVCAPSP